MTPMIDVTFLLLVFFLCTMQFNELKMKHDLNLPKDIGGCSPQADEFERCDIVVRKLSEERLSYTIGTDRFLELSTLRQRLDDFPIDTQVTIDMREGTINQEFMTVFDQVLDRSFERVHIAGTTELD